MNAYSMPGLVKSFITLEDFLKFTSEETGISIKDIKSRWKAVPVSDARHIYCYLARKYTNFTLKQIGEVIGRSDHTSVLNSVAVVNGYIRFDEVVRSNIERMEKQIPFKPVVHKTYAPPVEKKKKRKAPVNKVFVREVEEPEVKRFERPPAIYSNQRHH